MKYAILENGIWKLKEEVWLRLDPYNFKPYNSLQISKVVQKIKSVVDKLGCPIELPKRSCSPIQKLSNSGCEKSSQKYNSELSNGKKTTCDNSRKKITYDNSKGKTVCSKQDNQSCRVKTGTTKITSALTNSTQGRKGKSSKNSICNIKISGTNQEINSLSTEITTDIISSTNNKITQNSKYLVKNLKDLHELYSHFNHQMLIYEDIDASLVQYITKAKEILKELKEFQNYQSLFACEQKLAKINNLFGENSKFQEEFKTFYELQDDLKKVTKEFNRVAKEGILLE